MRAPIGLAVAFLALQCGQVVAADCRYVGYQEGLIAVEAGDGYDLQLDLDATVDGVKKKAGDVIDHCSSEPGDITRYSHCTGGWEGPLFFAGANNDDVSPGEIMVLQNEVYFQECP